MMKKSAGILLFKRKQEALQVLLVHPGGPFFAKKDSGVWSIPKGEFNDDEAPLAAAKREFFEETGKQVEGPFMPLEPVKLKSGKIVYAWAVESDFDTSGLKSNNFSIEWPPKSGLIKEFPEVDKAAWFTITEAREKISLGQSPLLDQLILHLQ